jgi:diacylglycerol kinase (ATP)
MASRTVAVLINPTSGRGKGGKLAPQVARSLHQAGIDMVDIVGTDASSALAMAREAVDTGVDALIACGGDGTIHLAVQVVAGTDVPLGIVPVGTGDDNARMLEIPRGDIEAAVAVISGWTPRRIDVARAETADGTSRYFLGVMSAGFDSLVNERANLLAWPKGQAKYLVATLAELRVFQPLPYHLDLDGRESDLEAMLVAVGNGRSYGGGMKVCPGAAIDDGELAVTVLGKVGKPTFVRVFPKVFSGTHVQHPSVSEHTAVRVRIDAPGQVAYADGERIGPLPVTAEVLPGALVVLAPPGAGYGTPVAP